MDQGPKSLRRGRQKEKEDPKGPSFSDTTGTEKEGKGGPDLVSRGSPVPGGLWDPRKKGEAVKEEKSIEQTRAHVN